MLLFIRSFCGIIEIIWEVFGVLFFNIIIKLEENKLILLPSSQLIICHVIRKAKVLIEGPRDSFMINQNSAKLCKLINNHENA